MVDGVVELGAFLDFGFGEKLGLAVGKGFESEERGHGFFVGVAFAEDLFEEALGDGVDGEEVVGGFRKVGGAGIVVLGDVFVGLVPMKT